MGGCVCFVVMHDGGEHKTLGLTVASQREDFCRCHMYHHRGRVNATKGDKKGQFSDNFFFVVFC